jgi:hypothetical protein
MNPRKVKKIAVLIPTLLLAVLLVQHNYSWIFGIMIGTAIALSSCELIQKAVNNSFVRKSGRKVTFFLFGFLFRFIFFAALLYVAIVYFKINVLAIAISFTLVQFAYPFYLVKSLENREKHV